MIQKKPNNLRDRNFNLKIFTEREKGQEVGATALFQTVKQNFDGLPTRTLLVKWSNPQTGYFHVLITSHI